MSLYKIVRVIGVMSSKEEYQELIDYLIDNDLYQNFFIILEHLLSFNAFKLDQNTSRETVFSMCWVYSNLITNSDP